MTKIWWKFILLFLLLLSIAIIGSNINTLPYYWGNKQINTKMEYLVETKKDPNIYFLGSSLTYRHVMPTVFDSITNKGVSFNLGGDGIFAPQTFHLIENLIKEDSSIDYIFLELNDIDKIGRRFGNIRTKYYLNPRWLFVVAQFLIHDDIAIEKKITTINTYFRSYFQKLYWIQMRKNLLSHLAGTNTLHPVTLGKQRDGFYPLLERLSKKNENQYNFESHLERIRNQFIDAYTKDGNKSGSNLFLLEKLIYYKDLLKEKDIKLIFIINPSPFQISKPARMVNLFAQLPEGHKIDLANPKIHADLYLYKYRWDSGHLNEIGAKIYTERLSKSFNLLVN